MSENAKQKYVSWIDKTEDSSDIFIIEIGLVVAYICGFEVYEYSWLTVKPFIFAAKNIHDSTPKQVHGPLISHFFHTSLTC